MAEVSLDNFKPNSNKYKEEVASEEKKKDEKRVKKPVTTDVIVKEKKKRGRIAAALFGDGEIGSIKDYLVFDVVIPALRNTIVDSVTNTVEMIFGVDPRRRRSERNAVSYSTYYKSGRNYDRRTDAPDRDSRYDYRDITFRSRVEADEALYNLRELVEDYDSAAVSDLYDLVGITGDFTDHKWGWRDLDNARVVPTYGGYRIDLPRPRPIN